MSDIFREVDEEVRQDRALAFWTRYQTWFIVAAAVIVVVAAGWRFYTTRQQTFAEETGARYAAAVQASREGRSNVALEGLQSISRDGAPGYRQLAAIRAADELTATDRPRAIQSFDALSNDTAIDPLFRDVARLRAAMLRLDAGDANGAGAQLTVLASAGGPFRSTARELLATAAISTNDFAAAGRWLDEIVRDPSAPQDVKQRAEAFLGLVRSGKTPAK